MVEATIEDLKRIQSNGTDLIDGFKVKELSPEILKHLYQYQRYINYHIFKKEKDDIIFNIGPYETSLLMSNLFQKTNENIKMVVGRFSGAVSNLGSYQEELKKCIEKNVAIEVILLRKDFDVQSKALKILFDAQNDNKEVSIFVSTSKTEKVVRDIFNNFKQTVHFSIFDNDKYRIEMNPEEVRGFASFYSPVDTLALLDSYERIKLTTKKLD